MKKTILVLCLAIIPLAGLCPLNEKRIYIPVYEGINPYKSIWKAASMVESNNDTLAYNPIEKAVGIVQIRPIRLKDYNKRAGKSYKLQDCYNEKISREIFFYYISKYEADDISGICKDWNGSGQKHKEYIKKIKKQLSKLR